MKTILLLPLLLYVMGEDESTREQLRRRTLSDVIFRDKKSKSYELRDRLVKPQPFKLSIASFSTLEADLDCQDNIEASDADGNGLISSTEYSNFVSLQSSGRISAPFPEMPLAFVTLFLGEACETCFQKTGNSRCCIGSKAALDLTDPASEQFAATVEFICRFVNEAVAQLPSPPTNSPTASPTMSPIDQPSQTPTPLPTLTPTTKATVDPRALCMQFTYVLSTTDLDLTATDILNGAGNSIREGLETATEITVVDILNTTFPRTNRSRSLIGEADQGSKEALQLGLSSVMGDSQARSILESSDHRRALYGRHSRRNLVFYSESLPPKVVFVLDFDPEIFPEPDVNCDGVTAKCFVVQTQVCVLLEDGDDPAVVLGALMDGFRQAIDSGEFEDRIPNDVDVGR